MSCMRHEFILIQRIGTQSTQHSLFAVFFTYDCACVYVSEGVSECVRKRERERQREMIISIYMSPI